MAGDSVKGSRLQGSVLLPMPKVVDVNGADWGENKITAFGLAALGGAEIAGKALSLTPGLTAEEREGQRNALKALRESGQSGAGFGSSKELDEFRKIDSGRRIRSEKVRVSERLGDPSAPKSVSLIAIHQHKIPNIFPEDVLLQSKKASFLQNKKWDDYSHVPFVTIDPKDARDHDDACYAKPDDDPKNIGGHLIWVAIADVAHFVRSGDAIDNEARHRGNSTYSVSYTHLTLPTKRIV